MYDDGRTVRELDLALDPSSASVARAAVIAFLSEEDFAAREQDGALAVSEMVTNAVLHGRQPITLRLCTTPDGVRIEVHDASPVSPAFSMLDPTAVTGRGLVLVAAVADGWGVDPDETGKTVWFSFSRGKASRGESDRLLQSWGDTLREDPAREQVRVVVTDVDSRLLAAGEAHAEGLLRELTLVGPDSEFAGKAEAILRASAPLDALRLEIRHQVAVALSEGRDVLDITLTVRREDGEQVRDFLHALEEADRLSRQGGLLVSPTPPETSAFRTRFLMRILDQLRS